MMEKDAQPLPSLRLLFIHICIGNTIGNECNAFNV